jgi:hypothetical protein
MGALFILAQATVAFDTGMTVAITNIKQRHIPVYG